MTKQQGASSLEGPYTWEDFITMPDDGLDYELLDGHLVLRHPVWEGLNINPPLLIHQLISRLIAHRLGARCEAQGLGLFLYAPTGIRLGPKQGPEPDALFIKADRVAELSGREGILGPPDVVIEILSPSTERKDLLQKRRIYSKHGIPEYWILSPEERSVTVLILESAGYVDCEPVTGDQLIPTRVLAAVPVKARELFPE